jgi:hypothetical protein
MVLTTNIRNWLLNVATGCPAHVRSLCTVQYPDRKGKAVAMGRSAAGENPIILPTAALVAGVYYVSAQSGQERICLRFIKL